MDDAQGQGGFRVALVGRRLADNENLGLAYLRAALRQAGFAVETHVLNEGGDLARIGAELCARPPGLVGLSLPDGGSAFLPLALGELLSARGFPGHVTCGGPFATLARRWLLERYAWLDSVVRFAGEVPLVELARRVAAGAPVDGVAGVTTRAGDGRPAPVTAAAPLALRPAREELPRVLGHHAAHIAATRGCRGRCLYCGPAALQTLERDEGRRAGIPSGELDRCGVGGVRRRALDDLCDEMAELWRERDVRYFYFVDEHLLPYGEAEALEFLEAWRAGLRRRRVGRCGLGGMMRADRLTPAIARALAALGFVRVFLGLEFATEGEARWYGRRAPGPAELELVRLFGALGVVTVSNLMLVHPDSTPASIAAGIDLLARLPAGSFEATRMMAYHGTRLHERLARAGRLSGNPLRWGYRIDDPVVDRFSQIFARLRGEVLGDYSVGYRTHDAFLALALRRRLGRPPAAETMERLERVRCEVNGLCVEAYRAALALAHAGGGFDDCGELLDGSRARVERLHHELERLEATLLAGPRARTLLRPMRAAAAGAISFCLLAAAPSCGRCPDRTGGAHAGASPEVPAQVDAGPAYDAGAGTSAADAEATATAEAQAGGSALECTSDRQAAETRSLQQRVHEIDACFSGSIGIEEDTPETRRIYEASSVTRDRLVWRAHPDGRLYTYRFAASDLAGYTGFVVCDDSSAARASEKRLAEALEGESFACAGPYSVGIAGGAQPDVARMTEAARGCNLSGGGFQVVLDAAGAVVDVRATDNGRGSTEARRCVRAALRNLVFPCLAGFEVCPEYVIVE